MNKSITKAALMSGLLFSFSAAYADSDDAERTNANSGDHGKAVCKDVPSYSKLLAALDDATGNPPAGNGGFNLNMWGTVVNRDGIVCAVAFTGTNRGSQWPGSRAISAQKANTGNAFSLDTLALSSANLYPLAQPGAFLFGLQESNPVDTKNAYRGPSSKYGTPDDPLVGFKIGGINVFGGGFPLYKDGKVVGGLGVSGDTSCADHNIGWKTRIGLGLDATPTNDNIVYGPNAHPFCLGGETPPVP